MRCGLRGNCCHRVPAALTTDPVQFGMYEVALMLGGVEWWFHSCCCCWREMHGAEVKLFLPQVSEESGQYKHHLQSLQVVNPTYIQGVCQSH